MDMTPHVDQWRRQFEAAAATGTPKVREAAALLATSLDAATRLMLVEALSEAAGEISRELAPSSIDMRVRGSQVDFVVTAPEAALHDIDIPVEPVGMGGDSTRTTLRIPDELKERAETAAAAEGVSLNSWLVRAASVQLEAGSRSRRGRAAARMTGWGKQAD